MKTFTQDGRTGYYYLERGVTGDVVVVLVSTADPDSYNAHRHSYQGLGIGKSVFDFLSPSDVSLRAQKAEVRSGADEAAGEIVLIK